MVRCSVASPLRWFLYSEVQGLKVQNGICAFPVVQLQAPQIDCYLWFCFCYLNFIFKHIQWYNLWCNAKGHRGCSSRRAFVTSTIFDFFVRLNLAFRGLFPFKKKGKGGPRPWLKMLGRCLFPSILISLYIGIILYLDLETERKTRCCTFKFQAAGLHFPVFWKRSYMSLHPLIWSRLESVGVLQ